jgi:hypothetical protein
LNWVCQHDFNQDFGSLVVNLQDTSTTWKQKAGNQSSFTQATRAFNINAYPFFGGSAISKNAVLKKAIERPRV